MKKAKTNIINKEIEEAFKKNVECSLEIDSIPIEITLKYYVNY
jgi:hypothetical protein